MHPFSGDRRAVIVTAIDFELEMQFQPMIVFSDWMTVSVRGRYTSDAYKLLSSEFPF